MARLFKKRKEKKQAEEAARKQSIQDLKLKNQAKRDKKAKDMAALAEAKKSKSPGSVSAAPSRVTVGSKTYTSQAAADMAKAREESKAADETTKRGRSNIQARRSVEIGETYERTNPDGTKRKMIKRDQSKPSQQNNQPKPTTQTSSSNNSEFSKTFSEERKKQGAGGKFAFKGKSYTTNLKEEESNMAKHGGALAIMIAPVKNKNKKTVKAIKKGDKAEKGASLKSVPSEAKGLSKLPKSVRNKMGYMKNGGKVTDPKKKKRTTTTTKNTPSVYSKFTDAQKSQIKARGEKKTGEDKKDFDYDLARTKDTKSKTTTTTKRRSGKVKSESVTEKRKSSIPGRSTDITTTSKKRRGGSTRVKTTSYGAGDDRDAGRVVKQKFSRKGKLKKTKVLKAAYGASMKKKAMYGAKMKKMEDGGKLTKSQKLQQRDEDLKKKATTAFKEGKTKKYSRVQKRRVKVQKREQKAFMKENT